MDPAVRQRRHAQRWEAAETNARRIAISGLIFAALILLNVVEPHFRVEDQKSRLPQWQSELADLKSEKARLEARKRELAEIRGVLNKIAADVQASPWQADIQALMDDCVRGCPLDPNWRRATDTIDNIARKMQQISVEPLRQVIAGKSMEAEFEAAAQNIENEIGDWREKHTGRVWWSTRRAKREAGAEVGSQVGAATQDASGMANRLNSSTNEEIQALNASLEAQQQQLDSDEKDIEQKIEASEEKIRQALAAALPAWAAGLFTPESMVSLYPWILVMIGLWVVGSGLIAGHHFRGMSDAEGWSAVERGDPLLSSPWTLTWRGLKGGAMTLLYYGAVLGALTYCIYRSVNARGAGETSTDADLSVIADKQPIELAFVLLALALVAVAVSVWRRAS